MARGNTDIARGNTDTTRDNTDTVRGNINTARINMDAARINMDTIRGNMDNTRDNVDTAKDNMDITKDSMHVKSDNIDTTIIPVSYQGEHCYNISLNHDFLGLCDALAALGYHDHTKICIVTDSNVAELYLDEVSSLLQTHFCNCTSFVFEAGEGSKNTDTVGQVYSHLIAHQFDRKDLILALGGGVVGDLAGFSAATYLRGIDFVQIPTSLLAQVDSSIGGKTGVDYLNYKNMVGAFYMPKLVYMNLSVLRTLPNRQFYAGMGEIIKHGQIKSRPYFEYVAASCSEILRQDPDAAAKMIEISCEIKRDVVERDPREQGERAMLNFGHTFGHAIEKLSAFTLYHGECVALGMVGAAYLSAKYGEYSWEDLHQLEKTLSAYHLPVRLPSDGPLAAISDEEILKATKLDKKMESGRVKFIFLHTVGDAYITRELDDEQLLEGIAYLKGIIHEN